jgi:hypothetical protein
VEDVHETADVLEKMRQCNKGLKANLLIEKRRIALGKNVENIAVDVGWRHADFGKGSFANAKT